MLTIILIALANTACTSIPLANGGDLRHSVCLEAMPPNAAVLDLSDGWTPRLFDEMTDGDRSHRDNIIALSNERIPALPDRVTALRDRYYELFGIFPTFSVASGRLADDARHECHAAVNAGALAAWQGPWSGDVAPGRRDLRAAALREVQAHLRCDKLLPAATVEGDFDAATRAALATYQRMHMLPGHIDSDEETRQTLLTSSAELDFRTLLRALRERVVDATGMIEDGSALNAWSPILGRHVDSIEFRTPQLSGGMTRGAEDLVAAATETAAIALGWTSPGHARDALARGLPSRVVVGLPPMPSYHGPQMDLRAEIDRGDVWRHRKQSPFGRRPTLVLYVRTPAGEIPLVRWPTTVGGWQLESMPNGAISYQYKESPVGRRHWRDLVAAPAWFPPPTTPDSELVHQGSSGRWKLNTGAVGPGYRSAYGLMALFHHRASNNPSAVSAFSDTGIRTHGSGNYRSIMRGTSHGCHRLFNHLAMRLGSFLLAHRTTVRHGTIREQYTRTVSWKGRQMVLRISERGYRYELTPPIPVDVTTGRKDRLPTSGDVPAMAMNNEGCEETN